MLKRYVFFPAIWITVLVLWALPTLAETIVDTAWVRRYDGPASDFDYGTAMAIDRNGNLYVTGGSQGDVQTGCDFATVKYSPYGDTMWVRRYNGPANDYDMACGITVDYHSNVYATGKSLGNSTGYDYATIKYYPNGDTAWVRRYDGPGNSDDEVCAISVDDSGYVYVTGSSGGYCTIKYNPNGDTAWVRRYTAGETTWDHAFAMTVDDSGHIYVTGCSGSNENYDYITIKYNRNGDTAWVRRFSEPGETFEVARAITVDRFYNVYVTGYCDAQGKCDYLTIKYHPNGDTAWVRRYNGPGNAYDCALAIVVDASDYVYVTGSSDQDSLYPYNPDYATIRYYPNGDTAWVRRYNGTGKNDDVPQAISVDSSNNVYVTGCSYTIDSGCDYATVRYNADGSAAWLIRYNSGPGYSDDDPCAIAVDDSGYVYVTGSGSGATSGPDYLTIKYAQLYFVRGDLNTDGIIDVEDVVYLINYLFIGGPAPQPLAAGDANCDSNVNVVDVVYLINYLFIGGPPPC
jgi:hypothetical protein